MSNPHDNPTRYARLSSFHRREVWGSEKFGHLLKVTQIFESGIQVWFSNWNIPTITCCFSQRCTSEGTRFRKSFTHCSPPKSSDLGNMFECLKQTNRHSQTFSLAERSKSFWSALGFSAKDTRQKYQHDALDSYHICFPVPVLRQCNWLRNLLIKLQVELQSERNCLLVVSLWKQVGNLLARREWADLRYHPKIFLMWALPCRKFLPLKLK